MAQPDLHTSEDSALSTSPNDFVLSSVHPELAKKIDKKVFHLVGEAADSLNRDCYVVGGYVRDLMLHRRSKDIDFVTVGSGIEVAREVAGKLKKSHLSVFRNFGTAQVKNSSYELEFVGARRESYKRDSRNPIVEDGTLLDDISRRDFTINAMALCVNGNRFGHLIDLYDGENDLKDRLIRTPLDPDITFSDDPLRMMRAIRFATQLDFTIVPETFKAIRRNASRISIITRERIMDELMKIMKAPKPSIGWTLLLQSGLLKLIFPEMDALRGVEQVRGVGHKDNFYHTLAVLDNVAEHSDNVWLRWAALLHDIGKPKTKRWDDNAGWTFYGHNVVGAKMVPSIFKKMKFPLNDKMKYVQKLVELHMRPIALVEDEVTDSAVRRLLFDAGDDVDDLMLLCSADITSKNRDKVERFRANYELVKQKMVELEERDRIRNFQPPVDGIEIMQTFGLGECRQVGVIKERIKNAILDGEIPNEHDAAREFMLRFATDELGLTPAENA
jgi:poly(A) polymerase